MPPSLTLEPSPHHSIDHSPATYRSGIGHKVMMLSPVTESARNDRNNNQLDKGNRNLKNLRGQMRQTDINEIRVPPIGNYPNNAG